MNDIKLLGRLTNAPELKKSNAGHTYAWFTVAVPRKSDKNEADFIRCVAFGKLASAMEQYCTKGRQILVQGRLQVSQSTDQQTQQTRYHHTVVAHAANFLHDPRYAQASAEAPFLGFFRLSMVPERLESLEDKELTAFLASKLISSGKTKFFPA